MIRVFSFVGSCAGESSVTAALSDLFAKVFQEVAGTAGEQVSYERMTGADLHLEYCRSCNNCFKHGVCPLDSLDDMPRLKEKMLECDVLFFCSPVYLWQMSGVAKTVLDRISYWTHRFQLLGKPCAVFASTDMSYGAEVAKTLQQLMSFTGAVIVNAGYENRKYREDPEAFREILRPAAERLLEVYKDPCLGITPFQQKAFFSRVYLNRRVLLLAKEKEMEIWDEVRVCQERGITRYVLMSEAIKALCGEKQKEMEVVTNERHIP